MTCPEIRPGGQQMLAPAVGGRPGFECGFRQVDAQNKALAPVE